MKFRDFILFIFSALSLIACSGNDLPSRPPVDEVVWLDQNWSPEQRRWFNHANQGTHTFFIPYEWFMALEQPGLQVFGERGLISDSGFLAQLGFIPGEAGRNNTTELPVGFAIDPDAVDPVTGEQVNGLGLTCAACHTGHLTYKGTAVRFSGGPGMINPGELMSVLLRSLLETAFNERQFARFATRVLGEDHARADRTALKRRFFKTFLFLFEQLSAGIKAQSRQIILDDIENDRESELLHDIARNVQANLEQREGFGRTDALNRIGNQVFGIAAGKPHNFVAPDAPVSFPFIWSSSWFLWVQYDGSIMQPVVRNAGEALGVGALVNLQPDDPHHFASTVHVENLIRIEQLLAGSAAPFENDGFTGLTAPRWPEKILGDIDRDKARIGRQLYREHCQSCHLPPVASEAFWDERYWSARNQAGERLLNLNQYSLETIGTDPNQANVLATRKVDTTGLGIDTRIYAGTECRPTHVTGGENESFAFALGALVQETVHQWYDSHDVPANRQPEFNGQLPNCLRAPQSYKARPLNGIWATAPYLHNGSVPDLYALLSPLEDRPRRFYVGNLEFDPVNVGYRSEKQNGLFAFDTTQAGNANTGHLFSDTGGKGVIGPALSETQRYALIEFLKTL